MPKVEGGREKCEWLQIRLSPKMKNNIRTMAQRDGLDLSSWARHIFITELRRRHGVRPVLMELAESNNTPKLTFGEEG